MSYHDKKLIATAKRHRKDTAFVHMIVRGFHDITFKPEPLRVKIGSLADDWAAVGSDMRTAMKRFEIGE